MYAIDADSNEIVFFEPPAPLPPLLPAHVPGRKDGREEDLQQQQQGGGEASSIINSRKGEENLRGRGKAAVVPLEKALWEGSKRVQLHVDLEVTETNGWLLVRWFDRVLTEDSSACPHCYAVITNLLCPDLLPSSNHARACLLST